MERHNEDQIIRVHWSCNKCGVASTIDVPKSTRALDVVSHATFRHKHRSPHCTCATKIGETEAIESPSNEQAE